MEIYPKLSPTALCSVAAALSAALSGTGYGVPEWCADGLTGGGMALATGAGAECRRGGDRGVSARNAIDGHGCTVVGLYRCLSDRMFFGPGYAGIGFASRPLI